MTGPVELEALALARHSHPVPAARRVGTGKHGEQREHCYSGTYSEDTEPIGIWTVAVGVGGVTALSNPDEGLSHVGYHYEKLEESCDFRSSYQAAAASPRHEHWLTGGNDEIQWVLGVLLVTTLLQAVQVKCGQCAVSQIVVGIPEVHRVGCGKEDAPDDYTWRVTFSLCRQRREDSRQ
jgi:hypothetical protein